MKRNIAIGSIDFCRLKLLWHCLFFSRQIRFYRFSADCFRLFPSQLPYVSKSIDSCYCSCYCSCSCWDVKLLSLNPEFFLTFEYLEARWGFFRLPGDYLEFLPDFRRFFFFQILEDSLSLLILSRSIKLFDSSWRLSKITWKDLDSLEILISLFETFRGFVFPIIACS